MLGVPDLRTKASGRFMSDAQAAFDMDGFEEPAELLYQNTRADDLDLITRLCVENHKRFEIRPKTVAVLPHNEPSVWHITVAIMKWGAPNRPLGTRVRGAWRAYGNSPEDIVEDCNDKRSTKIDCGHISYTKAAMLKLEDDGSLTIPCPNC